jgi:hypothetical protein
MPVLAAQSLACGRLARGRATVLAGSRRPEPQTRPMPVVPGNPGARDDATPRADTLVCVGPRAFRPQGAGSFGGARAIGSAGERLVHTEEVTGSIPVSPTSSGPGVRPGRTVFQTDPSDSRMGSSRAGPGFQLTADLAHAGGPHRPPLTPPPQARTPQFAGPRRAVRRRPPVGCAAGTRRV